VAAADHVGVLALPAQPGGLAQRFFHDRGGIDEDFDLRLRFLRHDPAGQRLERAFDEVVIIDPLRIDRNPRAVGHIGQRQRVVRGA
jgi:hypothetical protein